MRAIEVDTSQWPLVTIRFPAEAIADDDLRSYLGTLGSFAGAGQRYATLTDVRALPTPLTAGQRWLFDAWMRRNVGVLEEVTVANAIVANSPITRSSVATVYWHWSDQPRFKLFEDVDSARRWCRARLDRAGVSSGVAPRAPASPVPPRPAPTAETLDLFDEPAFLVTPQGEVVFANRAACEAFPAPPAWLAAAVSTGPAACSASVRIARVDAPGRELFVVIPGAGAAIAELPPRLEQIARLLARGLADKEIAASTGLTVRTVRTYVQRLYRRAGVHSRGELLHRWFARPGGPP